MKDSIRDLSAKGALLTLVAAIAVVAMGFIAGRAIGTDEDADAGSIPTRVATQQVPERIPTLGEADRVPALEVSETASPSVETESEESSSAAPVEPEPESTAPSPQTSSPPEVTVAPDG